MAFMDDRFDNYLSRQEVSEIRASDRQLISDLQRRLKVANKRAEYETALWEIVQNKGTSAIEHIEIASKALGEKPTT